MATLTRILSIDGGGIRGILPGKILEFLELRLQQRTDNPDARLADYFDLVAGTGTGGIMTCAYLSPNRTTGRPAFQASDVVDFFLERGGKIFNEPFFHKIRTMGELVDETYPREGLEDALNNLFSNRRLSELVLPCLIPAYDVQHRRVHFFASHDARKWKGSQFYLRDVGRASSAVPAYFECAWVPAFNGVHYPLVDGGVFANNPTMCAIVEANKVLKERQGLGAGPASAGLVVLSLGTGEARTPYSYQEVKDWKRNDWVRPVLDIMMSGASDTVDYQVGKLFDRAGSPENYFRISPPLPRGVHDAMDAAFAENLTALVELAEKTVEDFSDQLDRLVELLVDNGARPASSPC